MRHRPTIAFLLAGLIALCACDAVRPAADATAATGANPEACRRCHGSADNAAPPHSVHGLTATSEVAVGAHQTHLRDGPLHQAISCDECHVVPAVVEAPGHIDDGRAQVTFGGIAHAGERNRSGIRRRRRAPRLTATARSPVAPGSPRCGRRWTAPRRPAGPVIRWARGRDATSSRGIARRAAVLAMEERTASSRRIPRST